jgi:hypothetical protein
MSKTTDTTKPRELTDDHRPLADSELDAVSGGTPGLANMLGQAVGQAISQATTQVTKESGRP